MKRPLKKSHYREQIKLSNRYEIFSYKKDKKEEKPIIHTSQEIDNAIDFCIIYHTLHEKPLFDTDMIDITDYIFSVSEDGNKIIYN